MLLFEWYCKTRINCISWLLNFAVFVHKFTELYRQFQAGVAGDAPLFYPYNLRILEMSIDHGVHVCVSGRTSARTVSLWRGRRYRTWTRRGERSAPLATWWSSSSPSSSSWTHSAMSSGSTSNGQFKEWPVNEALWFTYGLARYHWWFNKTRSFVRHLYNMSQLSTLSGSISSSQFKEWPPVNEKAVYVIWRSSTVVEHLIRTTYIIWPFLTIK